MTSLLKEFRDFAMKGNVLDLAVGVIIGGAFGKIISSLVSAVIMPLFGILLGNINFSGLEFTVGESTVKYGMFLQAIADFLVVAFCIFIIIKQINRFKKTAPPPPPAELPADVKLLTEIRDLLKK